MRAAVYYCFLFFAAAAAAASRPNLIWVLVDDWGYNDWVSVNFLIVFA